MKRFVKIYDEESRFGTERYFIIDKVKSNSKAKVCPCVCYNKKIADITCRALNIEHNKGKLK